MFHAVRNIVAEFLALFKQKANCSLTFEDEITTTDIPHLWEEYEMAMTFERKKYAHDQMNYNKEDFWQTCKDHDILKILFWVDGALAGFCFLTKPGHLNKAPWISVHFYGEGAVYVTILLIFQKFRRLGYSVTFFDLMIEKTSRAYPDAICGFDIPDIGKEWLYKIILHRIKRLGLRGSAVGAQRYFIVAPRSSSAR